MGFAQRLKKAMDNTHTTMYRLSKILKVHPTTIKNWLDGKSEPKSSTIEKIASALEIDVTELLQPLKVTEIDLGDGLKQRKEIHGEPGNKLTPEKEEAINKGLLLDSFDKLNDKGQQKAVAYVELLAGHPDYKKDKNA